MLYAFSVVIKKKKLFRIGTKVNKEIKRCHYKKENQMNTKEDNNGGNEGQKSFKTFRKYQRP